MKYRKPRICKNHGLLDDSNIRIVIVRGYECRQCLLCNKDSDKKKRQKEEYRKRNLERSRRPEQRAKQKLREIAYRERRREVNRALHQRKKDDPDYKAKSKKWKDDGYKRMKESMTDAYIKKVLKVYSKATPEMIENKRKEILELRRVREESKAKKQAKKYLISKLREEKKLKELNGIVKNCHIHGDLTSNQAYFASNGTKSINKQWFCKECKNQKGKSGYIKNRDTIIKRHKEYALKNIDTIRERTKQWYVRMSDKYIARYFTKVGIPINDIPRELIELKKTQLMIKRKLRKIKNDKHNEHENITTENVESV